MLVGFTSVGKIVYMKSTSQVLILDTNRGVVYEQDLSNRTLGIFPEARMGANIALGKLHFTIQQHTTILC